MSAPSEKRADRRMALFIVALVLLWGAAMVNRNQIRARWWAYRLARSQQLDVRTHYLALLVSLGEPSVIAASALLRHEDAAVRSYGLVILQHAPSDEAGALLVEATGDADADLREQAVLTLGRRKNVSALKSLAQSPDQTVACAAAASLASVGSDQAIEILIQQVRHDKRTAVRVQAIECLGELGAGQATEVLTACLDDPTLYAGTTASQRSAARAIGTLRPDLALEQPSPRTVGQFAAEALQRITGHPRPATDAQP